MGARLKIERNLQNMKQWSKSIYARTVFILTVVLVVAGILIANLFDLQVVKYDYYLGKVLDNLIQ